LAIAFAVLTVSALLLTSAYGQAPQAQSLGLEDPGKTMNVHILLNLRNESGLRSLVSSIQDKNSPNYHKFLTKEQFATQFAPTAADAKKVANYLTANGLTVTNIDSHNLVVSATGTVAALQTAFSTQIEKAELNGEIFNRPTVEPTVPSSISPLIKTVAGLHTMKAKSTLARQVKNVNNQVVEVPPVKFIKTKPNGVYFPGDCFSKNNDALYLYGTGLEGIYTGNQLPDAGCGYSPAEMQHAYGFDSVIQGGIDGTGQFVTIVDPYGSATILSDANLFSSKYGLPALVPGTNFFQIYNPAGSTPDCVESLTNACGWEVETTLDVEWAHAMAPGAGIILVNPATESLSDLWYADLWIALNLPSGTVSHSYGLPESEVQYYDPTDFTDQYLVNEIVAGFGVSNNYASGDGGDFYGDGMYTSPTDVSFPSGSPDATSVGGTSLALTSTGNYKWETGWGNNIALIGYVPPYTYFRSGAGGGTSQVTAAPTWQSNFLGNTWRQQPDVAMDADPFTGAEVIYTDYWDSSPAVTYVTVVGGTSLSTPMFSAVYALAGQEAGTPYLGNAAANAIVENYLFPGSFKDIVPVGSGHNAHGTIFCNGVPCYNESQWDLAGPYQSSTVFYESIWNANLITVTFGTDSSLTTGPGWDNVTGVGTPNGWYFIGPY
jgi:subtilase family serine protease